MKHITNYEYNELMKKHHENNEYHEVGTFSVNKYAMDNVSGEEFVTEYKVNNGVKLQTEEGEVYLFWNEYSDRNEFVLAKEEDLVQKFEFIRNEISDEEKQRIKEENLKKEKEAIKYEMPLYNDTTTPFEFIKKRMEKERKEKRARKILEFLHDNQYLPEIEVDNENLKVSIKDREGVELRNYEMAIIQSDAFSVEVEDEYGIEEVFPLIPDIDNITIDGEKITEEEIKKNDYELWETLEEISFFDKEYHLLLEEHEDFDSKYWLNIDSEDKFVLIDALKENIDNKYVQERKKEFQLNLAEESNKKTRKPKI